MSKQERKQMFDTRWKCWYGGEAIASPPTRKHEMPYSICYPNRYTSYYCLSGSNTFIHSITQPNARVDARIDVSVNVRIDVREGVNWSYLVKDGEMIHH